jgi:ribosome-binding ATPase
MPSVGFIGAPGSGKSTVFRALTGQDSPPQFLGYDLKPQQAMVRIPDSRLDWLAEHYQTKSKVHAAMEFVDIPGYDIQATERKLATAVLEHYRRLDALVLVIGLYDELAPLAAKQARALLDELVISDLANFERASGNLEKQAKLKADKDATARLELVKRITASLEEGIAVRNMVLSEDELRSLKDLAPLSAKPLIAVLNLADADYSKAYSEIPGMAEAVTLCAEEKIETIRTSASLEAELGSMSAEEAAEFMSEYGISEAALPRFINAAFRSLGLIVFLTASEKECRTWPVRKGSNAQQSAGVIHSDLAKGFIRAETVAFSDFESLGGEKEAKAQGKYRLEGKEYIVQDGDIMHIRHSG